MREFFLPISPTSNSMSVKRMKRGRSRNWRWKLNPVLPQPQSSWNNWANDSFKPWLVETLRWAAQPVSQTK